MLIFINVSRGKVVKTADLVRTLQSGHLAGAGLDVTDPEPLPSDHPLWDMPHVTVTSHISGRSQYSARRMFDVFVANIHRYVHGFPMLNMVNKDLGF